MTYSNIVRNIVDTIFIRKTKIYFEKSLTKFLLSLSSSLWGLLIISYENYFIWDWRRCKKDLPIRLLIRFSRKNYSTPFKQDNRSKLYLKSSANFFLYIKFKKYIYIYIHNTFTRISQTFLNVFQAIISIDARSVGLQWMKFDRKVSEYVEFSALGSIFL